MHKYKQNIKYWLLKVKSRYLLLDRLKIVKNIKIFSFLFAFCIFNLIPDFKSFINIFEPSIKIFRSFNFRFFENSRFS